MDRGNRVFWRFVASAICWIGLSACVSTQHTQIAPAIVAGFKGETRFDQSLLDHPPQTVAVLPFLDRTEKKEAFDIVRKSFHGHFSKLNYMAIPLFKIDDALRKAGLDTPEKAFAASPAKLREILHTDAIIKGEVTHYDRIYVGVYSQVAVGAEVRMVDSKSGTELWWGKDVSRKHSGGISTTPVGLILTAVSSALNMREIELLRSSDDLFRGMIKTIPQPTVAQAMRPPNITILVHDGMRRTDKYASKVGDVIKVALEGDPRMKASFRIGEFKKELPLQEEEQGVYTGSYKILPGDNVAEALIIGTLTNEVGNSSEWVDVLGPVTIDTAPPEIPQGLRVMGRDKRVDIRWEKNTDKDIARYRVYRSVTPLTGYQELGTTEWNTFPDEKVEPGKKYYYKIAAIDLVGNESKGSEAAEWMLVAPGPTPVRGLIATDTLWYADASPYVITGEITVAPKAELRIEPGTMIQSQGAGIIVQGKLLARGDQTSLITFTGKDWRGISFQDTRDTESAIEYAKISGAAIGISCVSSSPLIVHNQIAHNQVGIRVQESFAQPKIIGNIISANAHTGVEIAAMASPQLEDNEIRGNQENGVLIRDAKPVLVKNRITNNGEVGVSVYSSPARLRENNIHDNGKYAVHNALENEVTVDALDNWWGFAEGRRILSQFFGRIDTQRVLDGPFPQGKSIELPILKGPLSGPIERDSFLVRMHSPYVLEKGVTITQGATLFAEPGVAIKYNPGAALVVKDGGIDAQGTEDRMIIFSANSVSPSAGYYPAAVQFTGRTPVASFFRYCIFEYGEMGLDVIYGAPDIHYSFIGPQSQVGIRAANDAEPKISFSTFSKNGGTGAVLVQGNARPKMTRNNFQENPFAVQSFSSITIDARENWWGSSPPSDSQFLGEINYKPWLEAPEAKACQGRKP